MWATFRAGHAGTANGAWELLAQALTMLPPEHRIGLVRVDAGFCATAFLEALEARDLPSIIVARLTRVVRTMVIHRIPEPEWRPVARDVAVVDTTATVPAWREPARRFVCLRQTLIERPEAIDRQLIERPGYYTYCLFVTVVPYAAELVTRIYAGRADSENPIKELKEDLSLDTFCLRSFDATDAAFRTGCALYNLLMGFRETVLPTCWFERRLSAVRDRVFLVGADLARTYESPRSLLRGDSYVRAPCRLRPRP